MPDVVVQNTGFWLMERGDMRHIRSCWRERALRKFYETHWRESRSNSESRRFDALRRLQMYWLPLVNVTHHWYITNEMIAEKNR